MKLSPAQQRIIEILRSKGSFIYEEIAASKPLFRTLGWRIPAELHYFLVDPAWTGLGITRLNYHTFRVLFKRNLLNQNGLDSKGHQTFILNLARANRIK